MLEEDGGQVRETFNAQKGSSLAFMPPQDTFEGAAAILSNVTRSCTVTCEVVALQGSDLFSLKGQNEEPRIRRPV